MLTFRAREKQQKWINRSFAMALGLLLEAEVAVPELGSGGGEGGCSSKAKYHPKRVFFAVLRPKNGF